MGFIGGKADQPAPISHDREAASDLATRCRQAVRKATPKTVFEPGEIVRVALTARSMTLTALLRK